MSEIRYDFEGQILSLTNEDISPFYNNGIDKVQIGKLTEFKLKDGRSIVGTPQIKSEDIIYPIDLDGYGDLPLQSKFTVKTENGEEIVLTFTELKSHSVLPASNGEPLFR